MSDKVDGAGPSTGAVPGQTTDAKAAAEPSGGKGIGAGAGAGNAEVESLKQQVAKLESMARDRQSEADKLRAENERIRNEQLAKLTEAVTRQNTPQDHTVEDHRQRMKASLQKALNDGDPEVLFGVLSDIARSNDEYAKQLVESKRAEIKREYDERINSLTETIQSRDPVYLQHKQKVDAVMQKYGIDRQRATQIVAELSPAAAPATPPPPGTTGSDFVSEAPGLTSDAERIINDALALHTTGGPLKDSEKKALAERSKRSSRRRV